MNTVSYETHHSKELMVLLAMTTSVVTLIFDKNVTVSQCCEVRISAARFHSVYISGFHIFACRLNCWPSEGQRMLIRRMRR